MSSQNLGIPPQLVHLALVWPIARLLHKARTHRIFDDVMPFLIITFVPPQLRIPEMTLPDRGVLRIQPMSCTVRLSKFYPFLERTGGTTAVSSQICYL